MKLYDSKMAPNPRRLRIFLAEKGIQVPDEQVDLAKAQNRAPEFLKINPYGGVPVLELDDGTNLAESVAICVCSSGRSTALDPLDPMPRSMVSMHRRPSGRARPSHFEWNLAARNEPG